MRTTLDIGCSPYNEDCVQVCHDADYMTMMNREARVFQNQLERMAAAGTFGDQSGAWFKVASNPHEFGTYKEIEVSYDDNSEAQEDFAINCQNEMPESWDDEARKELGQDYFDYLALQKQRRNDVIHI